MEDKQAIIEQNKALCEKYPFLTWYSDPLYVGYTEENGSNYEYTWADELLPGWRKAFGNKIWDELYEILEKANYVNEFRFHQIKEKYGTLRLYYGGIPTEISDDVHNWASKYEELSMLYCCFCGEPTKYITDGWILYVCEDDFNKKHRLGSKLTKDDIIEYTSYKDGKWIKRPAMFRDKMLEQWS